MFWFTFWQNFYVQITMLQHILLHDVTRDRQSWAHAQLKHVIEVTVDQHALSPQPRAVQLEAWEERSTCPCTSVRDFTCTCTYVYTRTLLDENVYRFQNITCKIKYCGISCSMSRTSSCKLVLAPVNRSSSCWLRELTWGFDHYRCRHHSMSALRTLAVSRHATCNRLRTNRIVIHCMYYCIMESEKAKTEVKVALHSQPVGTK